MKRLLIVAVVALLAACSPPSDVVARAVVEACAKAGLVARYDGINHSIYCVPVDK